MAFLRLIAKLRVALTDGSTLQLQKSGEHTSTVPEPKAVRPLAAHPPWEDMPRFVQERDRPLATIRIDTDADSSELSTIFDQTITDKTQSIWYPKLKRGLGSWGWLSDTNVQPRYPLYIISKGRPKCITARALARMGVPFQIVVEPSDVASYRALWGSRVITGEFDTTTRSSIPVRNYVDQIAPTTKYWLLDDNIEDFNYLTDNQKYVVRTPAIFAATEDFVERYTNIGQAGFNYYSFSKKTERVPPYYLNTRIYSCTLMIKDVDIERDGGKLWRGRYNEDTDLSLRILKAGYCTVLMNVFLAGKVSTQRMSGGNTDTVYTDGDERKAFAESLREQHPDCVEVVRKFKRWHHKVDYKRFKQQLIVGDPHTVRDYGLRLDPQGRDYTAPVPKKRAAPPAKEIKMKRGTALLDAYKSLKAVKKPLPEKPVGTTLLHNRGQAIALTAYALEALTNEQQNLVWAVDLENDVGTPDGLNDPDGYSDSRWTKTIARLNQALKIHREQNNMGREQKIVEGKETGFTMITKCHVGDFTSSETRWSAVELLERQSVTIASFAQFPPPYAPWLLKTTKEIHTMTESRTTIESYFIDGVPF